jgi:DNA polymerase-3 subunit delta'
MPTIVSRCQPVRFDPLSPERIAAELSAGSELSGEQAEHARACARLALGDAARAALLVGEQGAELRGSAEDFVRRALCGDTAARPWLRLLELARAAGAVAGEETVQRIAAELELLPAKERKRHEREAGDARRRTERRARTATLDLLLGLAELWLRDLLCVREGAPDLIHALDRRSQLEAEAEACDPESVRAGIALVADTRLRLALNVSEELALEALAYRLGGRSGERTEIGL